MVFTRHFFQASPIFGNLGLSSFQVPLFVAHATFSDLGFQFFVAAIFGDVRS